MKGHKLNKQIKPVFLIFVLIILLYTVRHYGAAERLTLIKSWIADKGIWGMAVFILIYAASVTALIPGSVLTVMAGAIFGTAVGTVTVSIASTLGAALSFIISRYFARDTLSVLLDKNPKFKKLYDMTETHGNIIVAITRLVPLFPFTLLNYGFGLTKIPFKAYLFWSWLCMLPGTVLYISGSDAVSRIIREGEAPWFLIMLFIAVLVMITVIVRRIKKTI